MVSRLGWIDYERMVMCILIIQIMNVAACSGAQPYNQPQVATEAGLSRSGRCNYTATSGRPLGLDWPTRKSFLSLASTYPVDILSCQLDPGRSLELEDECATATIQPHRAEGQASTRPLAGGVRLSESRRAISL